MDKVHYSSASDNWATPEWLMAELREQFGIFDLDPCADKFNAKAVKYFTRESNGLDHYWPGLVYMNPPYGREIGKWVEKARFAQVVDGSLGVVCLLPARTDTRWFHDYCLAGNVRFLKGRLKFGDAKNAAPFPSMIVTFGVDDAKAHIRG